MQVYFRSWNPLWLLPLCGLFLACPGAEVRTDAPPAAAARRLSPEVSGPQIVASLTQGDYFTAVALTEQTDLPRAERDQAVGQIVLDAHADPNATTMPSIGIPGALSRLEAAALAGSQRAASSLYAVFRNGLSQEGKRAQLMPQPHLASCWQAVEGATKTASDCTKLRQ